VPEHPVRASRLTVAVSGAALVLAVLTACGNDSGDGDAAATTTSEAPATSGAETSSSAGASESGEAESITATEADFSITLDEDSLSAGTYEIDVVNSGSATHDLVVEQDGNDVAGTDPIAPGDSSTLTVTLEPGEYVFYCSIGNHRAMGMERTVRVT
jgi:plastocyanin